MPPETTLLFKALVVAIVCLLQSPAFRTKVFRRRARPAPPPIPAIITGGAEIPEETVRGR